MASAGSNGLITDPRVVEYRSILLRAVKSARPIRLPNGHQMFRTEPALVQEMMAYCWATWISPMRGTFQGYFLEVLDSWPDEKLNRLQQLAPLTDHADPVVQFFCDVEFPRFVLACMKDIDATIHRGVLKQAFECYPAGSSMSVADFIRQQYSWVSKRSDPVSAFFYSYQNSFVARKPIVTVPYLLPSTNPAQQRMAPADVPAFIADTCAKLLDRRLKAAIAEKMKNRAPART